MLKKIIMMIIKKILLSDKYVRFPRLFGYFELYLLFTNMYVGLFTAVKRFIWLFIILLVAIFRIDQAAVPQWVYKKFNKDSINISYLGLCYMYHCHNHPINVSFKLFLENFAKRLQMFTAEHFDKNKKSLEEKNNCLNSLPSKKNYLKDKINMAILLSKNKFEGDDLKVWRAKVRIEKKKEEEEKKKKEKEDKKGGKKEEKLKKEEILQKEEENKTL
jgi:hypothetical protein